MPKIKITDPRQELCLSYYFDPKSPTFSDLKNSAMKAGFTESYADNLFSLMPDWLSDSIGQNKMLSKAERNLDQMLDLETMEAERENANLLRIKADVSKFITERLGKKKYAQRNENINLNIPVPIYGGKSISGHERNSQNIQPDQKN